jgi:hypothetical protein
MAHLLLGVAFEAGVRLGQQRGRHAQVHLGGGQMGMPQVDRQLRQQFLDVGTLPIPGRQSVNGKGVPLMPSSA